MPLDEDSVNTSIFTVLIQFENTRKLYTLLQF